MMQGAYFSALTALLSASQAMAADSISLVSDVFVEKAETNAEGRSQITLHQPRQVAPGDNLVFVLRYRNQGNAPAKNVSVTNPMPAAVSFREARSPKAQYSVDGGHQWGMLSLLKVQEPAGKWRAARPEDVTHVRWTFRQPLPAGAAGKLTFRGTVR